MVILAVIVANGYSLWRSTPELAPMDAMTRLGTLARDPGQGIGENSPILPDTALALQTTGLQNSSARADAVLGKALPAVRISTVLTAGNKNTQPVLSQGATRSILVEPGETLGAALQRLFIHGETARAVIGAYTTLRNPQKLQAGWRLWARFDTAGVMDASTLRTLVIAPGGELHTADVDSGESLTIQRGDSGEFQASEGGLPGTTVRTALRCGIIGSLEASLRRCGEGEGLVELLQPLLTDRLLQPIDLRTGDELRLVVDKLMDGDHVERYLGIAALEHRSVLQPGKPEGKTIALNFHGGLYAPTGQGLEPLLLRQPLRVGRQTSTFGMRLHPILHKMKAHLGVDFGANRGTPVYAAGDGHLVSADRAGAAGNVVRLRHELGYTTEYMHLQKFASGLKANDVVHKGQLIGFVGSTGLSTGPHLHFGVRHNGKYLDPAALTDVVQPPISVRDRAAFEQESQALLDLLAALGRGLGDGA